MTEQDELDPFIAGIARELKAPVRFDPRFDERVMHALSPAVVPITVHRTARPWYRRTFAFSVSQLSGLAAAAALVGIVSMSLLQDGTPAQVAAVPAELQLTPVANVTGDDTPVAVMEQFIVVVPTAERVTLVGDFNGWDASRTVMRRVSPDGAWSVTLPLYPGRYEYQFEIDGAQRITDPSRPQASSEFGSANSVVTVEAKE